MKGWIEYTKRSAREVDEKMVTQHHKLGRDTEETEIATSPTDRHLQPKQMDQKRSRAGFGTCHIDEISMKSRKTSQRDGKMT